LQPAQLHQQQEQAPGPLRNLYGFRITCAKDTLSSQTSLTNVETRFQDFGVRILGSEQ